MGKASAETSTGGKGVLGPIPTMQKALSLGPNRPELDQGKRPEVRSAGMDKKDRPSPNKKKSGSQIELGPSSSGPPPTQLVKGPNNTSIQIVSIPTYESQQTGEQREDAPSSVLRTKNQKSHKKKKSKSPRKNPVTITATALQVWTPVKDKKNKTRARLASLTLQEIEAWTGAAKASTAEKSPLQAPKTECSERTSTTLEIAGST
ncbi:unnamed protein product [Linum trigynum]|uniref:Uncharacterized protein n=1 Tax=Linum trigynum TaxID=586398 RepID=A0AAV2C9L8_9ROSI